MAIYTPPVEVPAGAQLFGFMDGTNFHNGGYGNWYVKISDNYYPYTIYGSLSYSSYSQLNDLKFTYGFVTLEVYNVVQCSDLPSSSTTFSDIAVEDQNFNSFTPSWSSEIPIVLCSGQSVVINSASSITLNY